MIKYITILSMIIVFLIPSTSGAGKGWKSFLSEDNKPLHWDSCTVRYGVDLNGRSSKPLNAAIKNIEAISGLDFKKWNYNYAALQINLTNKKHNKYLAYTEWTYSDSEIFLAETHVYKDTYKQSYKMQVDLYRHELGHALGLDHVKGSDIMSVAAMKNQTRVGWTKGLRTLYKKCRG